MARPSGEDRLVSVGPNVDADGTASGSPRFVPLRVDYLERIERAELSCDAWAVLTYLIVMAKTHGDTGLVWTCSPTIASTLRNLTDARAKRSLEDLERQGFIRRFRARGSRGLYPLLIDGYVVFNSERHMRLVDAGKTADYRDPVTVPCASRHPSGDPSTLPRLARRRTPPCIEPREPENQNHEGEGLSVADAPAPKARRSRATENPADPVPTAELIAFWQAADKRDGIEPHGEYGQHAKILARLWRAVGRDLERAYAVIDAYRSDRSAFVVEQGHSVAELGRTLEKWIRKANGTAPVPTPRGPLGQADSALSSFLNGQSRDSLQLEYGDEVPL